MPEFLKLKTPAEAREILFAHVRTPLEESELITSEAALGRVAAEEITAPHSLPEFPRSMVDGYAVRAADTHGASESLPAYLTVRGEVPMGAAPGFRVESGYCGLIHTGGMLPEGSDAVVMLEYTQKVKRHTGGESEIEILRPVAEAENAIRAGEDVAEGSMVIERGQVIRPAEIGGVMALGIMHLRVVKRVRVGLIASGDEVVQASERPEMGQVRDVNTHTLMSLVLQAGGEAISYGIVPDDKAALLEAGQKALAECDVVVVTAGSSASSRDMTAEVIDLLGNPGVLVHGINTRPGKPTILGVCEEKAVIGLPGNPVSALVNGVLFLLPLMERLSGKKSAAIPTVRARLTTNLPSQAGREDWWPVRLLIAPEGDALPLAEPVHGKSNLIFTLARADGLLQIAADATGLSAGEIVEVRPLY